MVDRTATTRPWDAVIAFPKMRVGVQAPGANVETIYYLPPDAALLAPRNALAERAVRQLERYRDDPGVPFDLGFDSRNRADQHHSEIEVASGRQRPVDDEARRRVAPHGVNGDPDHRAGGLVLLDRTRLPTAVVPAVGADPVRRLRLVALGALGEAGGGEGVVRTALRRAGLGVSSLWIRHRLRILSSGP